MYTTNIQSKQFLNLIIRCSKIKFNQDFLHLTENSKNNKFKILSKKICQMSEAKIYIKSLKIKMLNIKDILFILI